MVSRLSAVLPKRWFAEESPNLDAILRSLATPWAWLYELINYVRKQSRLATATDTWLDLFACDYFGGVLSRRDNEDDSLYRRRIEKSILREAATRTAVSAIMQDLTGDVPVIFEPLNCLDTGAYSTLSPASFAPCTGLAFGAIGGWGSLSLPCQFFLTAARPPTFGFGDLAGYGTTTAGYGISTTSYSDLSLLPGHVTEQDIQSTLTNLLPVNTVAWLRVA